MEKKYSKKESFVDYLLNSVDESSSAESEQTHEGDAVMKLYKEVENVRHEIARIKNLALDSRLQVNKLGEEVKVVREIIDSEELPSFRINADNVMSPQSQKGQSDHTQNTTNFFELENLRLKQDNYNLLRLYNKTLFNVNSPAKVAVAEISANESAPIQTLKQPKIQEKNGNTMP